CAKGPRSCGTGYIKAENVVIELDGLFEVRYDRTEIARTSHDVALRRDLRCPAKNRPVEEENCPRRCGCKHSKMHSRKSHRSLHSRSYSTFQRRGQGLHLLFFEMRGLVSVSRESSDDVNETEQWQDQQCDQS